MEPVVSNFFARKLYKTQPKCSAFDFFGDTAKVHHELGHMKIKVKPEGAKLIFGGGDLDVKMRPAHGYVRPVHNFITSHHTDIHEDYHNDHDDRHDYHHHDNDIHHDDHDHDDFDIHHYHHDNHHDNHHDDDDHHDYHQHDDHHHDHHDDHHHDDGYGFGFLGHFHHFPHPGHGHGQGGLLPDGYFHGHAHEQGPNSHRLLNHEFFHRDEQDQHDIMENDFFHGHGGHEHGHFRNEIRKAIATATEQQNEGFGSSLKTAENVAANTRQIGSEAGQSVAEVHVQGRDQDILEERSLNDHGTDSSLYGKDVPATNPTHKSKIESGLSAFARKIVPSDADDDDDDDNGSGNRRSHGTLSPFDDENDTGENEYRPHFKSESHVSRFHDDHDDHDEDDRHHESRYHETEKHEEPRFDESVQRSHHDDSNDDEHRYSEHSDQSEPLTGTSRDSEEHAPNVDFKKLEMVANNIPPSIPREMPEERENNDNSRDIGSPRNVYVNMSGQAHNYGDEDSSEQDYPTRNSEMEEGRGESRSYKKAGDYNPSEEEERRDDVDDEGRKNRDDFEEEDQDDRELESMKRTMNEFRMKSQRIAKVANEVARKKDSSPPLVVHPGGDPRERDLKKAFYEYNPTYKQSKHLAAIADFSVRSDITSNKKPSFNDLSMLKRSIIAKKRNLMMNRLVKKLKSAW
eukprot:gene13811-15256_t